MWLLRRIHENNTQDLTQKEEKNGRRKREEEERRKGRKAKQSHL